MLYFNAKLSRSICTMRPKAIRVTFQFSFREISICKYIVLFSFSFLDVQKLFKILCVWTRDLRYVEIWSAISKLTCPHCVFNNNCNEIFRKNRFMYTTCYHVSVTNVCYVLLCTLYHLNWGLRCIYRLNFATSKYWQ